MKNIITSFALVLCSAIVLGQSKMTNFTAEKHGFKFTNTGFKPYLGRAGGISINFSGFCGGMAYAAGDYYYNNIKIPDQDYAPAPGTKLYKHLESNQSRSIENISGQIVEFTFNLGGGRNEEFWGWAVDEKLKELVKNINNNRPTPILLLRKDKGVAQNHWVIAVGYDLGGYKWRKKMDPNVDNIQIIVYDPNLSGAYRVLMPRKDKLDLGYYNYNFETKSKGDEIDDWACRSFHPNTNFYKHFRRPPIVPYEKTNGNGDVYKLVVSCTTGGDDLRGGNDNVSFRVNFGNGTSEYFPNANLRQRWSDQSVSNAELNLHTPRKLSDIKSIEISTNFSGGIGGDNWNLDNMIVKAYRNTLINRVSTLSSSSGSPWTRFTEKVRRKTVKSRLYKEKVSLTNDVVKIKFEFTTGGDDLRGGRDNLDLKVSFKNKPELQFKNVNKGLKWKDWTSKTVEVQFEKSIPLSQLDNVKLHTTFGGGMGGDNWNLNILKAWAIKEDGSEASILLEQGKPLFRFTGDKRNREYAFSK